MSPAKGEVSRETPAERGAYLVNSVMVCHNCHTPRGPQGLDLSRALSGGSQVFDEPAFKVTGSNITPDKETGIGNWTDAQLKHFLVSGVRPNGTATAPIMPTAFYTVLTNRDLDALTAYLRSVPPVHHETPAPEYRIASKPQTPTYAGKQAGEAELADKLGRGRYLLTIAHCLECHTPEGPSVVHDFAAASGKGGRTFRGPWGESISPNITSDSASRPRPVERRRDQARHHAGRCARRPQAKAPDGLRGLCHHDAARPRRHRGLRADAAGAVIVLTPR